MCDYSIADTSVGRAHLGAPHKSPGKLQSVCQLRIEYIILMSYLTIWRNYKW